MSFAQTARRPVTVRVPAKVNLELVVGPLRADGFHDLATVFQAVSLYDEVTVERAEDWAVTVEGPCAHGVPRDATNLAVRAARRLAREAGIDDPVRISITKDIPVAGGMAGGSADAAATLVACDAMWGLGHSRSQLEGFAAELGSDVAFALGGGTAIGSGRGEQLAPVLGRGSYHWVFALSDTGLSTPAVYAECDRLRRGHPVRAPRPTAAMMTALRSGDPAALGRALSNDLQPAALSLQPELADVLAAGLQYGALGGIVSGSGPTVAFLVADTEGALDLSVALTATGAAPTVRRAHGPVHGAHLVAGPGEPGGASVAPPSSTHRSG